MSSPTRTVGTKSKGRLTRRPTGPRTMKGKATSSKNALKHGLLSKEIILGSKLLPENESEFEELLRSYVDHYRPVGPNEKNQLEIAVIALWRLRRVLKAEAGEIRGHFFSALENDQRLHYALSVLDQNTLPESERIQALFTFIEHGSTLLARTVIPAPDVLDKLQRYESHLLRTHYRALNELERLQRMRLGDRVPAPVVVDIQQ